MAEVSVWWVPVWNETSRHLTFDEVNDASIPTEIYEHVLNGGTAGVMPRGVHFDPSPGDIVVFHFENTICEGEWQGNMGFVQSAEEATHLV